MILKKFDNSKRVKALQETILALNPLALPEFGADSDLGGESLAALSALLKDLTILKTGIVDHSAQQRLLDLVPVTVAPPCGWVDNRQIANVLQRKHLRSPTGEYDIVWHQTDVEMGERPTRYTDSSAHFFVTSGGLIVQLHDLEWVTHHAHALNETTIGIEMEGMFLGIKGDLSTWPKYHKALGRQPQHLTDSQILAAFALVRWLKSYLESRGGKLGKFYAHRQGSNTRDRDPGSEIWKEIVLPLAIELGVEVPHSEVFGKGKKIPKEWDDRSVEKY